MKIPDVVQPITNPNTLPTFKKLLRGDVDLTSKNVSEVFGNKKKLCFRSKTRGVKIPTNKKCEFPTSEGHNSNMADNISTYPFVYPNIVLIRTYIVTPETHYCSYHN